MVRLERTEVCLVDQNNAKHYIHFYSNQEGILGCVRKYSYASPVWGEIH